MTLLESVTTDMLCFNGGGQSSSNRESLFEQLVGRKCTFINKFYEEALVGY